MPEAPLQPRPSIGDDQFAHFELEIMAVDKPTDRRRWNGGPMASEEASEALHRAVDAFRESLIADGFKICHSGYGVHATMAASHVP